LFDEHLQSLEIETMISQAPRVTLENSFTSCRVISLSEADAQGTVAQAESSFDYRQANAASFSVPFSHLQASDFMLRVCALQLGATRMFLMRGSEVSGIEAPPALVSANVLSCRFRAICTGSAANIIVTSRINAVGDDSVGGNAATLQLRTVYSMSLNLADADHMGYHVPGVRLGILPKIPSRNIFIFAPFGGPAAVMLGKRRGGSKSAASNGTRAHSAGSKSSGPKSMHAHGAESKYANGPKGSSGKNGGKGVVGKKGVSSAFSGSSRAKHTKSMLLGVPGIGI
jgi:hypothetical protein